VDPSVIILALHLVRLTGIDGQHLEINPEQVIELRGARQVQPGQLGHHLVHPESKCVVFTTDGKFLAVAEDCDTVRLKLLGESNENRHFERSCSEGEGCVWRYRRG
jgi:hypothetical protein